MQNDSTSSFEQVIEGNKHRIYRICRVYALSPVEPEDLFQEVLLSIWSSFSKFEGRSSINTWVYRVTLNVCLSHKRRHSKETIRLDAVQFQIASAEKEQNEEEKFNALQECIKGLTEKDKSIVILVLEGLPYKEITDITGLSENHIAVKMKRIKSRLLKCINSKMSKKG